MNELAAKEAELSAAAAAHSSALAEKQEEIQALQQQLAQLSTSTTSTTSASSKPRAAEERAQHADLPYVRMRRNRRVRGMRGMRPCDGALAEPEAARDRATAAEENVGSLASEALSCEASQVGEDGGLGQDEPRAAPRALKKHSENKRRRRRHRRRRRRPPSPTSERTTIASRCLHSGLCATAGQKRRLDVDPSSVAWAYLLRLFCCGLLAVAYSAIAMGSSTGKY